MGTTPLVAQKAIAICGTLMPFKKSVLLPVAADDAVVVLHAVERDALCPCSCLLKCEYACFFRKTGADNQPAPVRRVCGEYNRRSALLGTQVGDCFHLCFDGSLVPEV